MTDDEEFLLEVLARLNPAHAPPGLFNEAVGTALGWFGSQDLSSLEDEQLGANPHVRPPHVGSDERKLLVQVMAASTALGLMERLALGLPKQTSLRLSMVFLRVGIAKLAGQRMTITDILREDERVLAPTPGSPEGERQPTFTEKTIRNSYIGLQTAGLLTTEPGQDSEGRNRYLRLTDQGERLFRSVISALRQ